MNFFPSLSPPPPPPPPPFLTSVSGGISGTSQPYNDNTLNNAGYATTSSSSSSTTSVTSSIIITSIVISSAIIISASIYILLRFLSHRSHFTSADDVVLHNRINRSPSPSSSHRHRDSYITALNSLPVFTFGSLNGNLTGGDCAVCLSKFEKEEQLRLLPLCCHAFHTQCIDAWLLSNQTCPLCRSDVYSTDTDLLNKNLSVNENMNENYISSINNSSNGSSFRVEIGNVSSRRRRISNEGIEGEGPRSYSLGSFEYILDNQAHEIPMDSTYMRGGLEVGLVDKESNSGGASMEALAGGSGGSWLREYVDRLSSRAVSFRSSGRFFSGSSRRNDVVVPVDEDLEDINNHAGEDISELFRWISGV